MGGEGKSTTRHHQGRLRAGRRGARACGLVLSCLLLVPVLLSTAGAFEWEIVKYQSRDYVTMESLKEFYRFESLTRADKKIIFRSPTLEMKAELTSQDLYINNVRFILSFPIIEYNGKVLVSRLDLAKLVDPVLRPSYIRTDKPFDTVIIDAGHGGHDGGARGVLGNEKDYALKLAGQLRDSLTKRGFKVKMTRSTDVFLTLGERVRIANSVDNAIFISLHFNSGRREAHGIETFALSPQGSSSTYTGRRSSDGQSFSGNQKDSENIALATAVHASVLHKIPSVDRGIKRARWAVLTGINKPAILFEGGFVTNSTECRKIATSSHRERLAEAIGDAVVNFRTAIMR